MDDVDEVVLVYVGMALTALPLFVVPSGSQWWSLALILWSLWWGWFFFVRPMKDKE